MARTLPTFLPRIAALVLVALAATAGLTFAAGSQVASAPPVPTVDTAPTPPLIVPEVRNLAFVFAKGTLADAGFAWKVEGSVRGYAANIVVTQSPAAGTRLVDTGAPLITLMLKRNGAYKQLGEADDTSSYPGTVVEPADLAGNALGPAAPVAETPTTPAKTATTPAATATTPAATTPATAPATTPAKTAKSATPATKPAGATIAKSKPAAWPKTRPVAFVDPGAKKEPLDEMPLPDRAKALGTWLDSHKTKSTKDAAYWLYQNEWIVAGAKMGWWHGAEALQGLITVDRRTQSLWGIGAKSASAAQQALDEVRAKAKS